MHKALTYLSGPTRTPKHFFCINMKYWLPASVSLTPDPGWTCRHPTCGWQRGKFCQGYLCLKGNTRPRDSLSEAVTWGLLNLYIVTAGVKLRSVACKKLSSHQGLVEELFRRKSFFSIFFLYITNSNSYIPQLLGKQTQFLDCIKLSPRRCRRLGENWGDPVSTRMGK